MQIGTLRRINIEIWLFKKPSLFIKVLAPPYPINPHRAGIVTNNFVSSKICRAFNAVKILAFNLALIQNISSFFVGSCSKFFLSFLFILNLKIKPCTISNKGLVAKPVRGL